jgi:hypothetical protein
VQAAGVLIECALPRHREGKKKRVEPGVIEAFSDVSPGSKYQPFISFRDRGQACEPIVN